MNTHPGGGAYPPPDPARSSPNPRRPVAVQRRSLPRFRVVLLNNADRDMMFVVRTIMELTRLCRTEATHKMWQAHYDGRSLVLTTHRERAELFAELFADRGVIVVVEPS